VARGFFGKLRGLKRFQSYLSLLLAEDESGVDQASAVFAEDCRGEIELVVEVCVAEDTG